MDSLWVWHLASSARLASSTSSAADVCIGVDSRQMGQLGVSRTVGRAPANVLQLCQRSDGGTQSVAWPGALLAKVVGYYRDIQGKLDGGSCGEHGTEV